MDSDASCDHDWHLVEAFLTSRGADQAYECSLCPAMSYAPGEAAVRETSRRDRATRR